MNEDKRCLKIVILGQTDSGKTTLAGHFLYKCGLIDQRTFEEFEKESIEMGKQAFKYAILFDRLKKQHEMDISSIISSIQFEINNYNIILMDTTSYRDYMKCLTRSISLANCALLVISASKGEFECAISKYSSTRRDLSFACTFGIEHLIILVNKMDTTDPPYSKDRFLEIQTEILRYLKRIQYQPKTILFIPISAWFGENLIEASNRMSWFDSSTLLKALDNLILSPIPVDRPLRFIVETIKKINNNEIIFEASVETGILEKEMTIQFLPSNYSAKIRSIQINDKITEKALTGDRVMITINGNHSDLQVGSIGSAETKRLF